MKWFGQECLKGLRVGTQSAEVALFEQFDGGSEFVEVLEVLESCSSLCFMVRKCIKQMLKCSNVELRVML